MEDNLQLYKLKCSNPENAMYLLGIFMPEVVMKSERPAGRYSRGLS